MTFSRKRLFVVWIGLCGLAAAQPQSRSELIDSVRVEKEANLTPETPPKPEWRIERIEHSRPYGMLTDADGFGVTYGGILPGWAFAVGPRYKRTDLWGGKLILKAQ